MDLAPQIGAVIDTLASKMAGLQAPAAHVWDVMVRQQVISGAMSMVPFIVMLILWIPLLVWARRSRDDLAKDPSYPYSHEDDRAYLIAAIIFGAMVLGIAFIVALDGLKHIINPEYYAIMALKP